MQNKKNSTSAIRLIKGIKKEKKPYYMPKEKPFEVLDDLAALRYCGDITAADPQCRLNPEAQEIDLR